MFGQLGPQIKRKGVRRPFDADARASAKDLRRGLSLSVCYSVLPKQNSDFAVRK